MNSSYDYIVVGAGSAGCILANRLTECGKYSVLILESGGSDNSFWFKIPVGFAKTFYKRSCNWMFYSEPEKELGDRRVYCPIGKVQGGSGSINAMIYVRGLDQDFDDWASEGNEGWSAKEVLPFFKKLEAHPSGDTEFHSSRGFMGITRMKDKVHAICHTFLEACRELGLPISDDFNGEMPLGGGIYDINVRNGKRDSSSFAYLHPAKKRSNLKVILKAHIDKILFENKRAVGVTWTRKGKRYSCRANREVILSCGAIHTPKLLQLSGIGDSVLLKKHLIPLIHDLPAVGKNLQDHLCVSFYYRASVKTLNDIFGSIRGQFKSGLQYLYNKKGPLVLSVNQAGGFFKLPDGKGNLSSTADIQIYFNPLSYELSKKGPAPIKPNPYSGFLVAFSSCRPTSRGTVEISSGKPEAHPLIRPNYLTTSKDIDEAISGCKFIRNLMETEALKKITLEEVLPGVAVSKYSKDDQQVTAYDEGLLKYFKDNAGSIYHLCGSCRMGSDPRTAVVDKRLRVHGIEGLRIVDASIFPNITSGNINAPTMMVAEKGAELILQDAFFRSNSISRSSLNGLDFYEGSSGAE
jgi:choline dehydrogenase